MPFYFLVNRTTRKDSCGSGVIPNQENVTPRYDQITLNLEDRKNKLQQILSPNPEDEGVWIHQNAWFHIADFEAGFSKK